MISVYPRLSRLKGIALDILFPQWCVGCGREGELICHTCRRLLPWLMPPLCPKCGRPQPSGILCSSCVSWKAEIDGIRAPFQFDGVIRQAVHQLKYKNLRALANPLANLLRTYLLNNAVPGEVLMPVPLHKKRLKERGYNQSSLIARELGELMNLPVVEDNLIRRGQTSPQTKAATVEERRDNVIDAFYCQDRRLQGKQILIIDDVSTSGATLNACADVLKADGAVSVWGLVVAREI